MIGVVTLLEEKDRTLGAIGHDLRTPLASLRIRAETVEPEEERERMIATIEEMTANLGRHSHARASGGRSREAFERSDVSELAEALAENIADMGQPGHAFGSTVPTLLDAQPNLLRRAIRNLVDNALKYGGDAPRST